MSVDKLRSRYSAVASGPPGSVPLVESAIVVDAIADLVYRRVGAYKPHPGGAKVDTIAGHIVNHKMVDGSIGLAVEVYAGESYSWARRDTCAVVSDKRLISRTVHESLEKAQDKLITHAQKWTGDGHALHLDTERLRYCNTVMGKVNGRLHVLRWMWIQYDVSEAQWVLHLMASDSALGPFSILSGGPGAHRPVPGRPFGTFAEAEAAYTEAMAELIATGYVVYCVDRSKSLIVPAPAPYHRVDVWYKERPPSAGAAYNVRCGLIRAVRNPKNITEVAWDVYVGEGICHTLMAVPTISSTDCTKMLTNFTLEQSYTAIATLTQTTNGWANDGWGKWHSLGPAL